MIFSNLDLKKFMYCIKPVIDHVGNDVEIGSSSWKKYPNSYYKEIHINYDVICKISCDKALDSGWFCYITYPIIAPIKTETYNYIKLGHMSTNTIRCPTRKACEEFCIRFVEEAFGVKHDN